MISFHFFDSVLTHGRCGCACVIWVLYPHCDAVSIQTQRHACIGQTGPRPYANHTPVPRGDLGQSQQPCEWVSPRWFGYVFYTTQSMHGKRLNTTIYDAQRGYEPSSTRLFFRSHRLQVLSAEIRFPGVLVGMPPARQLLAVFIIFVGVIRTLEPNDG